jgi:hypothetical protein
MNRERKLESIVESFLALLPAWIILVGLICIFASVYAYLYYFQRRKLVMFRRSLDISSGLGVMLHFSFLEFMMVFSLVNGSIFMDEDVKSDAFLAAAMLASTFSTIQLSFALWAIHYNFCTENVRAFKVRVEMFIDNNHKGIKKAL